MTVYGSTRSRNSRDCLGEASLPYWTTPAAELVRRGMGLAKCSDSPCIPFGGCTAGRRWRARCRSSADRPTGSPRSLDKCPGHIVVPARKPRTRSKILSSMASGIDVQTGKAGLNGGGKPRAGPGSYMKLLSWNVNGVRAALRYGLLDYLAHERADIVCLQETRCHIDAMAPLAGGSYHVFLNPAQKAGYSGTAILSRVVPRAVYYGHRPAPNTTTRAACSPPSTPIFISSTSTCPNAKDGLLRLPYRQRVGRGVSRLRAHVGGKQAGRLLRGFERRPHPARPRAAQAKRRQQGIHRRGTRRVRRLRAGGFLRHVPRVRAGNGALHLVEQRVGRGRGRKTSAGASTISSCPPRCAHVCGRRSSARR